MAEKLPSGAKARPLFSASYGTTKVVPFQNPTFTTALLRWQSASWKVVPFQNPTFTTVSSQTAVIPRHTFWLMISTM
jgi:hypothetical protein